MKISTEIGSAARLVGEGKAIEYYAKAGFDAWDFSLMVMCNYSWNKGKCLETNHPLAGKDYLKYVRLLKRIGEDNGIHCNQSHAPFPVNNDHVRSMLKRAIECTAEAGGKICIIHPDNYKGPEENSQMYFELLPFAKECGVKIATENMWAWDNLKDESSFAACATSESFLEHLKAVNDEDFVACLDIGHAEMRGSGSGAVNMIYALGDYLQALHIHDNDKWKDSHQIPFSMDINFNEIMKALKAIGYKGYLTLEADKYLSAYNEENIFDGIKNMATAAKKLLEIYKK